MDLEELFNGSVKYYTTLDHVTWDKISRITIGIGQAMLSGQLSLKLFLF